MKFELTILGTGAATPAAGRNPTAQLLNIQEHLFLIDCGEGTQMQLRKFKIKFQRINHIFISHLHGDHYLGLMGLISTMHLLGRSRDLNIYSVPELKDIIDLQLKCSGSYLSYKLNFVPLTGKAAREIVDTNLFKVTAFPLKHRIPCYGFRFDEKPKLRSIIGYRVEEYKVPVQWMHRLKLGEDYVAEDGMVVANSDLTKDAAGARSYAFCSDTAYSERVLETIEGVDLLYHEATFDESLRDRAKATAHSTAKDAANIAKLAKVKQLIIGHFSARYKDATSLLSEATPIFPATEAAEEGRAYPVE